MNRHHSETRSLNLNGKGKAVRRWDQEEQATPGAGSGTWSSLAGVPSHPEAASWASFLQL